MIQSPRDASIAFATMLLCAAFFTQHWWAMLIFAAVIFPWKFFGGIAEEHVLPWVREWRFTPREWMYKEDRRNLGEVRT